MAEEFELWSTIKQLSLNVHGERSLSHNPHTNTLFIPSAIPSLPNLTATDLQHTTLSPVGSLLLNVTTKHRHPNPSPTPRASSKRPFIIGFPTAHLIFCGSVAFSHQNQFAINAFSHRQK